MYYPASWRPYLVVMRAPAPQSLTEGTVLVLSVDLNPSICAARLDLRVDHNAYFADDLRWTC